MSNSKEIMAKNIKYYMDKKSISRQKLSDDLNIKYTTLATWLQADSYPRINSIEKMAKYFGIDKSDLVEEHKDNEQDNTAVTWDDLGMPYGGAMPKELKETYADLAHSYFKRHPEYLNKNGNKNNEEQ
ncbi:helix-turn-helix domain-containing protein [Lactobacillus crispatus]|uniref:helix-turn-helix domain-containing protein n=1 Tax=Lactobacillus crispatus TaxID=47770 RepID=UPI0020B69FB8|nr:helix-turn-helix transcriptional regulator [Lactobacillus crispatus]